MTTHAYMPIWPGGPCRLCVRMRGAHRVTVRCPERTCRYSDEVPEGDERWALQRHLRSAHGARR
jgi:hypothetical protein